MSFRGLYPALIFLALLLSLTASQLASGSEPPSSCHALLTEKAFLLDGRDAEYENWKRLKEPFTGNRARGISKLRELIRREGLTIVIEGQRPKIPAKLDALKFMYGTKLVFTGDYSRGPHGKITRGKEVVLHPGNAPALANVYRGAINPHLGFGRLHGVLNKWNEYVFAENVQPGVMPRTVQATGMIDAVPARGVARRMVGKINHDQVTRADVREWIGRVENFFVIVREEFPEGAFIKTASEFATKDKYGQITTMSADPKRIATKGLGDLRKLLKRVGRSSLAHPDVQNELLFSRSPEARFMHAFLRHPEGLLAQSKLDIALSSMGKPVEFRVDFIDGEAVRALFRHSSEYMPERAKAAMRFLNEFFSKAPGRFRYLSGGADVMFLSDGTMKLIEFNFGSHSEYIDSGAGYPVIPNIYIAKLQGKQTPLLRALDAVANESIEKQAEVLLGLNRMLGKSKWGNFSEVSYEGFRYLRDRKLETWAKEPTLEGARQLVEHFKSLAELVGPGDKDYKSYVTDAVPFLEERVGPLGN